MRRLLASKPPSCRLCSSSCPKNSLPTRHREPTPKATGPLAPPAAHATSSISEAWALAPAPGDCPRQSGVRGQPGSRVGSAFHSLRCLRRACKAGTNEASAFVRRAQHRGEIEKRSRKSKESLTEKGEEYPKHREQIQKYPDLKEHAVRQGR